MNENTALLCAQAKKQPPSAPTSPPCRVIAWEVTRRCNLACLHCRASAQNIPYDQELSLAEASKLIQSFPQTGSPLVIFTGGEPLLRLDIFELACLVKTQGLRAAMSVNGTLLTSQNVGQMQDSGISRCSVSIDAENALAHDKFRGVPGAFKQALNGMALLREAKLPFQINTTITPHNLRSLPNILNLCKQLGAVAWHIFLLVPVGRGKNLEGISPQAYEKALVWIYDQAKTQDIEIKPTCAPQYNRLASLRLPSHVATSINTASLNTKTGHYKNLEGNNTNTASKHAVTAPTGRLVAHPTPIPKETGGSITATQKPSIAGPIGRGCLGGVGFCFISHLGQVQPCGYLELNCGNVREKPFPLIWQYSEIFQNLRNPHAYTGKCGPCRYHNICGGCRARALAHSGDYLHDDPVCLFNNKNASLE